MYEYKYYFARNERIRGRGIGIGSREIDHKRSKGHKRRERHKSPQEFTKSPRYTVRTRIHLDWGVSNLGYKSQIQHVL